MKIGIIGTRGIPNYHGGFEQFAEFFSVYATQKGHDVYVYNSMNHPYKETLFNGVNIIHCNDPEKNIGTVGQFIYDFNCILDSRKRKFDIILQLGYTSSSIWGFLLPKRSKIITNMDGLEWKRAKYNSYVKRFLKYAEKLAVQSSDYLISDSLGIQDYIFKKYSINSKFIAYGAELFKVPNKKSLEKYNLVPFNYNIIIARLEPENNIEIILEGVVKSKTNMPTLVIGNYNTKFGRYLQKCFKNEKRIIFLGGIYDLEMLNNLRYFSNIYFHGHSVGGTNPSLLEAMSSNSFIVAHDNIFNKSILGNDALFFRSSEDIVKLLNLNKKDFKTFLDNNTLKIKNQYLWSKINSEYCNFLELCFQKSNII